MNYNVLGHEIYSRSPYGALMYARAFNEEACVHDVLDGSEDIDLNFEDRPITHDTTNDWYELEQRTLRCASAPRYWDYKHRKLCDNLKDVCGKWRPRPLGCC